MSRLDAPGESRYNPPDMHAKPPVNESVEALYQLQSPCRLCPHRCMVSRRPGNLGRCRAPAELTVASSGPHFGEERVLVGTGGSGTIFLSGCNLMCVFCQNHDLSHRASGSRWGVDDLVYAMRQLAATGCENINVVTPTHYAPQLADAVLRARQRGLHLPIVYNCGGYESVETLRLLDGIVSIYMPDVKFWSPRAAERYCNAPDYPQRVREALHEMHRQVGDLVIENEIARRGLLVRHLVMPGATDEGLAMLDWLADEVSPRTYVNVMGQYRPQHRSADFPEIDRRPTDDEVRELRTHAYRLGLRLAE